MKHEGRIQPLPNPAKSGLVRLALIGTPVVFVAYAVTLAIAHQLVPSQAMVASFANTLPTIIFALGAYAVIVRWLVGRNIGAQIVGHMLLAAVYAVLAYWLLMVMLGATGGSSPMRFTVEPFSLRGSAFQLLQNVTTYGVVAALAYVNARPEPMALVLADPSADAPERSLTRYFIRSGEEIRPVDVGEIVSIAGADDYAEVATTTGRHLVRMTLAEFEKALDPAKFVRVHRSHIVNVERIERAEPAGGGRLLLHMEDGAAVPASRAGARLLRERVI